MQKQPTIIVRVLASDYIKIEGNFINEFGSSIGTGAAFRGWDARKQVKEWLQYIKECQENGNIETRIIVKGDLTGRSAERCALTQALYGTPI